LRDAYKHLMLSVVAGQWIISICTSAWDMEGIDYAAEMASGEKAHA
jgi:hypothetical protein